MNVEHSTLWFFGIIVGVLWLVSSGGSNTGASKTFGAGTVAGGMAGALQGAF